MAVTGTGAANSAKFVGLEDTYFVVAPKYRHNGCSKGVQLRSHASLMASAAAVKLPPRRTLSLSLSSIALSTAPRLVIFMGNCSCMYGGNVWRTLGCMAVQVVAPAMPSLFFPAAVQQHAEEALNYRQALSHQVSFFSLRTSTVRRPLLNSLETLMSG